MQLQKFWFFESLSAQEIRELQTITLKKNYSKGEIVFYAQEKSKYLHFLADGSLKLYKHDSKENELVLHHLHAPNLVAEISNFEEMPYPANCSCETDATIYLIDYDKFKQQFLSKPAISIMFMKSLSKKIKALESFIHSNLTVDSYTKTARFLYEKLEEFNSMRQIDIASLLNITPETLSRNLARLKKERIIGKKGTLIEIIDLEKLLNIYRK